MSRLQSSMALLAFLSCTAFGRAQPTYKLDVKPNLKPAATLQLEGARLARSEVKDDPGFRLQYHFKKDGKTLSVVEGRSHPALDLPHTEPGTYTVVLELFYPNYRGGTQQKGEFKPISNVLTYRAEPGPRPEEPKIVRVEATPPAAPALGKPALVVQCGKGKGTQQDEVVGKGFGYKLVQGAVFDAWPATAGKTYCWYDPKQLIFEVALPPGAAGTLRLQFVDGDNLNRKQKLTVQGKVVGDFDSFGGAGKSVQVPISPDEAKSGTIAVLVQNLNPASNAVVSVVEFIPAPAK